MQYKEKIRGLERWRGGCAGAWSEHLLRNMNTELKCQHQQEEPGTPRLPAKLVLEGGDRQLSRLHIMAQPTCKSFIS